nr:hypothetical protein [Streptantibioticus cattleyicolor]
MSAGVLEVVARELEGALEGVAPVGDPVVVRAAARLPVVAGRAARRVGRPVVVVLPARGSLPEGDRRAAGELLALAERVHLLPYDPAVRQDRVAADEQLVRCCRQLVAVWDGSPSDGRDATAHLVAFAGGLGKPVRVVWPAGTVRYAGCGGAGKGAR